MIYLERAFFWLVTFLCGQLLSSRDANIRLGVVLRTMPVSSHEKMEYIHL